ncbi:pyridoxamine 5'-phosphate oxidase family protein [Asanoa sp. WMMD1127]|nr:pyridoxamine 5'-phosphate oxidase family protein [Asanoa sp. WMMD1127]MDG4825089.1 pyridoxamine 5'-phosphate oxidase family protein [Asanoa sp. WMMD1127]
MRARPLLAGRSTTSWTEALRRFGDASTYWLVTTSAEGRPHLVPVLAVVLDGTAHFAASGRTRKARDLAADPRCVIGASGPSVDMVVYGTATKVADEDRLRALADTYASKYGWQVTPRDGAFHDAEGAPTAGPPPYDVYGITPTRADGFATDADVEPTRWTADERRPAGVDRAGRTRAARA